MYMNWLSDSQLGDFTCIDFPCIFTDQVNIAWPTLSIIKYLQWKYCNTNK